MAVTIRGGAAARLLTRRRFLRTAASTALLTVGGGIAKPSISRVADRPASRTASNPATSRSIPAWCGRVPTGRRACWSRSPPPTASRRSAAPCHVDVLPESDFTGKLLLEDLPAGQDIFYRVRFQNLRRRRSSANRRSGASAPRRRAALDLVPLVGRHRRPRLGHRRGARRHAHLRDHAAQPARLLHPLRRQHLRRLPDRRAAAGCRTARCGATSSPRTNPRSRGRSPSSAATTNTICSTATCAPSTPRCRSSPNGTITRSPTTGVRAKTGAADRTATRASCNSPRAAAAPSTSSCRCAHAGRSRPRLPPDPLRSAARRVHARHALVPRHQPRRTARAPTSSARRSSPGSSAN